MWDAVLMCARLHWAFILNDWVRAGRGVIALHVEGCAILVACSKGLFQCGGGGVCKFFGAVLQARLFPERNGVTAFYTFFNGMAILFAILDHHNSK